MKNKVLMNMEGSVVMRSIELKDIKHLRCWKNAHKEFFFYKKEISEEDQLKWFMKYLERPDDHMFILENTTNAIGCIGARIFEDYVDVYNVILGDKKFKGQHVMTNAMNTLIFYCNKLYKDVPVRVRVLKNNPAIKWYENIRFTLVDEHDDYLLMEYDNPSL